MFKSFPHILSFLNKKDEDASLAKKPILTPVDNSERCSCQVDDNECSSTQVDTSEPPPTKVHGRHEYTDETGRYVVIEGPDGDLCIHLDTEGNFISEKWNRRPKIDTDDRCDLLRQSMMEAIMTTKDKASFFDSLTTKPELRKDDK